MRRELLQFRRGKKAKTQIRNARLALDDESELFAEIGFPLGEMTLWNDLKNIDCRRRFTCVAQRDRSKKPFVFATTGISVAGSKISTDQVVGCDGRSRPTIRGPNLNLGKYWRQPGVNICSRTRLIAREPVRCHPNRGDLCVDHLDRFKDGSNGLKTEPLVQTIGAGVLGGDFERHGFDASTTKTMQ